MRKKVVVMCVALVVTVLFGCGAKAATTEANGANGEGALESVDMPQAKALEGDLSETEIESVGTIKSLEWWGAYAKPSEATATELKLWAGYGDGNNCIDAISDTPLKTNVKKLTTEKETAPVDAENVEQTTVVTGKIWRDGGDWDVTESMSGISIEFGKIYEVDADGNRGAEIVSPSGSVQQAGIVAGKTYEAELEIFNDSENDVLRIVEINLSGYSNGEGYLSIVAFLTRDVVFWAAPNRNNPSVVPENQFFLKVDAHLVVTPENFYTLVEKDSEQQLLWHEIGVQLKSSEEVERYHLRTAVSLRETSKQKITFRFAVA